MQVVVKGLLGLAVLSALASCRIDTKGLGAQDAGLAEIQVPSPGASGTTGGVGTGVAGSGGPAGTGAVAGASGQAGTSGQAGAGAAGIGAGEAGKGEAGMGEAGMGEAGMGAAGMGAAGMGAAGMGAAGMGEAGMGEAGMGEAGTGAAGKGAAGTGAAGMPAVISKVGCADGTREGFLSQDKYPALAGCSGGWTIPGLVAANTQTPQCQRRGGNDGMLADGTGCSVADLCAEGWHVCESISEFKMKATSCTDGFSPSGGTPIFFATRQRGSGSGTVTCDPKNATDGTNNVYGCGNIGSPADGSCAPFTRMLRDNDCRLNRPWFCEEGPINYNLLELADVTKPGPLRGGVLCCR